MQLRQAVTNSTTYGSTLTIANFNILLVWQTALYVYLAWSSSSWFPYGFEICLEIVLKTQIFGIICHYKYNFQTFPRKEKLFAGVISLIRFWTQIIIVTLACMEYSWFFSLPKFVVKSTSLLQEDNCSEANSEGDNPRSTFMSLELDSCLNCQRKIAPY